MAIGNLLASEMLCENICSGGLHLHLYEIVCITGHPSLFLTTHLSPDWFGNPSCVSIKSQCSHKSTTAAWIQYFFAIDFLFFFTILLFPLHLSALFTHLEVPTAALSFVQLNKLTQSLFEDYQIHWLNIDFLAPGIDRKWHHLGTTRAASTPVLSAANVLYL